MKDMVFLVAVLALSVWAASHILPTAMDRESYRLQKVCEANKARGYHNQTCDHWHGDRP
jgi:hypothetical protein